MTYKEKLQRNFKWYYLISFFTGLDFVIPIWVAFQTRFLPFTAIALIHSFSYFMTMALELPTGALADLLGRKRTVMLGWVIQGLGYIYMSTADNIVVFITAVAIEGVGAALVSGSDVALLYDTAKELGTESSFPKYMTKLSFIFRIGLAVGSLFGGFLYQIYVGLPYILMGVSQIFSLVFILQLVEPKIDSEKFSVRNYLLQTKIGFQQILKSLYVKKLALYYMLVGGISWACVAYFNQPFAQDVGFNEITMSLLFGGLYMLASVVMYLAASYPNIITKNRMYVGLPILMAVALLPGVVSTKLIAGAALFIMIFVASCRFSFLNSYSNEEFESKYRATAVSALNMLVSIFFIVFVGLSGSMQDLYGTKIIWTSLGVISLLVVLPLGVSLTKHTRS